MLKIDGLINTKYVSSQVIRRKSSSKYVKAISHKSISFYEEKGWEVVKRLKKQVRIEKAKPHDTAFKERIWSLFARMEFEYLNDDETFAISPLGNLTSGIDVFAIDKEAILVVKCLSSEIRKRGTFEKEISSFLDLRAAIKIASQKLIPGKQKITFILATNNVVLSDNDRVLLEGASVWHFNQDDIDYFEQLSENLGFAAKYQLFGKLFKNQHIPELNTKVPAVKGKIASGHIFYSFSIEPTILLKLGYILHRTETNAKTLNAYQRLVKKSRLKKISEYINNGGYFPNSIIINIETKSTKALQFDKASQISHDSTTDFGVLHLPKRYRSIFIIDGQHRLYGYSKANFNPKQLVPVVAFHNLPYKEQTKIFVDINHQQKSVPANLLRSIMADFNWNSEDANAALSSLKTRLLTEMNYDENSPLYKRIIIAEEKKTQTRCLTLQTLLTWGINTKVNFFGKVKGKKIIEPGYLSAATYALTLKKSIEFFNKCFRLFEDELNYQWNLGSAEGGFISMNIGVSGIFRTLESVLEHLVTNEHLDPQAMGGEELAEEVIPYLMPVVQYIRELDDDTTRQFRRLLGSGATGRLHRHFQKSINEVYPNFQPEGLHIWIKDNSGEFTDKSRSLGYKIESKIDEFVKFKLKEIYGEEDWWRLGIPQDIQKKCASTRIEKLTDEPDWNFLNTIHYLTIIDKKWSQFGSYFTQPGFENASKNKKLDWLKGFNSIRQKYSHPQRENVTEDEYTFLLQLDTWLTPQLEI